jgi:hypothetical protein
MKTPESTGKYPASTPYLSLDPPSLSGTGPMVFLLLLLLLVDVQLWLLTIVVKGFGYCYGHWQALLCHPLPVAIAQVNMMCFLLP